VERGQVGCWRVRCRAAGRFESRVMRQVGAEEAVLFFRGGVVGGVAAVWEFGVVVVVAPFGLFEKSARCWKGRKVQRFGW
jgi:hypothetical protein